MQARDVMTSHVVTIDANASVRELADLLIKRGISAVPVVGPRGEIVGIVSEGDLMRRSELGTAKSRPWWLRILAGEYALAADFIKANAKKIGDVMTRDVITAPPDAPLNEIARLMERHGIKRVPIVHGKQLVGIVSRANLVQSFASLQKKPHLELSPTDLAIRDRIMTRLESEPWAHTSLLNVLVNDGVVDLWGIVHTAIEKDAVRVAAESTSGVRAVNDNLILRPLEIAT
ncbi:MAG TPA: CBS domain-containing protein [Xanthobacteraceae bacterium]|jgi:CBS domain-containing protein